DRNRPSERVQGVASREKESAEGECPMRQIGPVVRDAGGDALFGDSRRADGQKSDGARQDTSHFRTSFPGEDESAWRARLVRAEWDNNADATVVRCELVHISPKNTGRTRRACSRPAHRSRHAPTADSPG